MFHSTKSNDFNANFSFGITAAVHPWNQLNFYVTELKNTQASRDNRSCIFHAQLECSILCRYIDSAAPALSRASPCRLNDAFNVMSFLHGSDISRLFLHATNFCQCAHEFSRVSGHLTHCWAYRPVYREMNSLVVKVSKLVHFEPDSHVCLELTLFPDVDVLCAFNDESNLSHVLLAAGPRSTRPTTTHSGHRPESSLHHVNKKFSRVSAFNSAHLSGQTQDANYASFNCNHTLLERFITHSQLRHTSFQ